MKRPCARIGCPETVEVIPGRPGRPQEYCSAECRRAVEYALRDRARGVQEPTHKAVITNLAKLRRHVIRMYGADVWKKLASPALNADALELLYENWTASRCPPPAWSQLRRAHGWTVAELHAAGGSVRGRDEWDRSIEDHDSRLGRGVIKLRHPGTPGGETRNSERGGNTDLEIAGMMDRFEAALGDRDTLAGQVSRWYASLTDDELEIVCRDTAGLAAVQGDTDYGPVWQAVAVTSEAALAARQGTDPLELLTRDEVAALVEELGATLDELDAQGKDTTAVGLAYVKAVHEWGRRLAAAPSGAGMAGVTA